MSESHCLAAVVISVVSIFLGDIAKFIPMERTSSSIGVGVLRLMITFDLFGAG